jgi:hypothetical protein
MLSPASRRLSNWTSMAGAADPATLWIARTAILLFAIAMLAITWAAWPSLVVDCGREMYVPAAMAQGKRLYRDVWYTYGPLAPTVNAELFRIFGTSLNTLYFVGLAIFVTSALVLHSIALRLMPPVAALVCALSFLLPGFRSSFFNEILPYSYSATLGALICLLTLLFLIRYLEHRAGPNLVWAGLFAALGILSKFEFFFPVSGGIVVAFLLRDRRGQRFSAELGQAIIALLPGIALAMGVYGWLLHQYGLDYLVHTNWQTAPGSYFMQHYGPLWLRQTGLRFIPAETAKLLFFDILALCAWIALAVLFAKKSSRLVTAAFILGIAFLAYASQTILISLDNPVFGGFSPGAQARAFANHIVFPQGMYLIVFAWLFFLIVRGLRERHVPSGTLMVTIVMGLGLALRIMMELRAQDYAIYSSSILFIAFIALLWRFIDHFSSRPESARRSFSIVLYFAAYAVLFAAMMTDLYKDLPWPLIHTPMGDVRRNPQNITLVNEFLPVMQKAKSEGKRVLLLPEITGLYFISGMQSPSHYEVFVPGVLEPGKYMEIFLRELGQNPPDLIILSNRRTSEYGAEYFGIDYDQEFMQWIDRRYHVTGEIGHFERRDGAPLSALIYTPYTPVN